MNLIFAIIIGMYGSALCDQEKELVIAMPGVSIQEEVHMQRAIKLDPDHAIYITAVVPYFQYAMHIVLNACRKPFSSEHVWDGESVCKDGVDFIILSTTSDSGGYSLPKGVGFKVGGDSELQYLVLRLHYFGTFPPNGTVDRSSITVIYTTTPTAHIAGFIGIRVLGGNFMPGKEEMVEGAVVIDEDVVLHLFALKVHTHALGLVVSAYRVRGDQWTEIGRRSPQIPQIYAPSNKITLRKGDMLAVRWTIFNFKDHIVRTGVLHENEMCMVQFAYFVNGQTLFSKTTFILAGPPAYYWSTDKRLDTSNVPADASEIPPPPDGPEPGQMEEQEEHSEMRDLHEEFDGRENEWQERE